MKTIFPKDADHGLHFLSRLHVSSCYTGPLSAAAFDDTIRAAEIREALGTDFGANQEFGNQAIQADSRIAIANILDTNVRNIALTFNTNDGLHKIRSGLGLTTEDQVLLYRAEYLDVKTPFIKRSDTLGGCTPIYIEGEKDRIGRPLGFDLAEVETAIKKNKIRMVVVTHVQFTSGFTTDLAALANICKTNEIPLVVDAAQSFGALKINPDQLGISALVAPLWKWIGGYRGNAFLWTAPAFRDKLNVEFLSASGMEVKDWLTNVSLAPLHQDARKFETSTLPTESWIPTRVMLNETSEQGIKKIEREVRKLQALARSLLTGNERIGIFQPPSSEQPSLGSFVAVYLKGDYAGREAEVVNRLRSLRPKPIDVTARGGFIRLALHKFNSVQTVETVCTDLRKAVLEL